MGGSVKKITSNKNLMAGAGLSNPLGPGGMLASSTGAAKSLLGLERFKGGVSGIDPKAFGIQGGQEAAGIAGSKSKEAQERGKVTEQAQENLRGKRGVLIRDFERQLAGEKPSLAESQLKQAQDRSLKQQLAAAGRARGGSAASTQRALLRGQAEQAQATGREAAQARIKEDQLARQGLSQALASGQQIEQQQMAQEQGQVEKYLALGFNMNQAMQQAQADLANLKVQQELGLQKIQQASFDSAQANRAKAGSGLLQGAMAAFAGSDENMKKNIKKESSVSSVKGSANSSNVNDRKKSLAKSIKTDSKSNSKPSKDPVESKKEKSYKGLTGFAGQFEKVADAIRRTGGDSVEKSDKNAKKNIKKEFLDKLTAYSYDYKDPKAKGAGEGRHYSVMAQDLEKAGPVGKSMVKEENGTKYVDYGKGFGAILAAQASLNERLNEIEKKKKRK